MKLQNVKLTFCNKTNELLWFKLGNRDNLSHKRKVELKQIKKQFKKS